MTCGAVRPVAPAGMEVGTLSWIVRFHGPRSSIGFSLIRPEILHLGCDGVGGGREAENRVQASGASYPSDMGLHTGLSGPVLHPPRGVQANDPGVVAGVRCDRREPAAGTAAGGARPRRPAPAGRLRQPPGRSPVHTGMAGEQGDAPCTAPEGR